MPQAHAEAGQDSMNRPSMAFFEQMTQGVPGHAHPPTTQTNTLRTRPFVPDRRKEGISYVDTQAFTALDRPTGCAAGAGYLLRRRPYGAISRGKRRSIA